jgi:IgA-specific serine endopeptidase
MSDKSSRERWEEIGRFADVEQENARAKQQHISVAELRRRDEAVRIEAQHTQQERQRDKAITQTHLEQWRTERAHMRDAPIQYIEPDGARVQSSAHVEMDNQIMRGEQSLQTAHQSFQRDMQGATAPLEKPFSELDNKARDEFNTVSSRATDEREMSQQESLSDRYNRVITEREHSTEQAPSRDMGR